MRLGRVGGWRRCSFWPRRWPCRRARRTRPERSPARARNLCRLEYPDGGDVATITLTEDAARRLDVQTAAVVSAGGGGSGQTVIPYAAVLYDPSGDTWTYTSPEHLVFVRAPIDVKRIEGQSAILVSGPPVGTEVVTVGESELLGSEYEVGGE